MPAKKKVSKKKKKATKKTAKKTATKKKKDPWYEQEVSTPKQLYDVLKGPLKVKNQGYYNPHQLHEPNIEVKWNNRWYPVHARLDKWEAGGFFGFGFGFLGLGDEDGEKKKKRKKYHYELEATLFINQKMRKNFWKSLGKNLFEDDEGNPVERKVSDILEELGFRPLQMTWEEYEDLVSKAHKMRHEVGIQYHATGPGVIQERCWWWWNLDTVAVGSPGSPERVIVDPQLELDEDRDDDDYYDDYYHDDKKKDEFFLPYVRVFATGSKKYCWIDIRDLQEYPYDDKAIDRLVLPEKMGKTLRKVFTAPQDQLFGDILANKHGGMVILASGGPGVGKTLTAEVFADHTKRPLYILEVGELGTSPEAVEKNLQVVFKRATRWNAVLLFDEADIFMAKRDDNLARNAIVGIFLRLLDYYPGLMFLTTNRCDIIDEAFKSRITLTLRYPALDKEARTKVWRNFFEIANVDLVKSPVKSVVDVGKTGIPDLVLNGRQIRNLTRLIKLLHPDRVTPEEVCELYEYTGAEPEETEKPLIEDECVL